MSNTNTNSNTARAAAPEGKGPSESDVADLFYRHMGEGSEVGFENAIAEALARWGQPAAPPAPAGGAVGELVAKLYRLSHQNPLGIADPTITRVAALLEQLSAAAPAMVPVPVSERLPEPDVKVLGHYVNDNTVMENKG